MLAVTLKSLEADGLVTRTVYPQIPPKVEYQLTNMATTLLPHIQQLVKWANLHIDEIKVSREIYANA